MQESMQCTDNGTLRVMSKSLQEYKFNAEGMSRGNPGLLRSDQPYKVSSDSACLCKCNFYEHLWSSVKLADVI